jgi:hypothetical protein
MNIFIVIINLLIYVSTNIIIYLLLKIFIINNNIF